MPTRPRSSDSGASSASGRRHHLLRVLAAVVALGVVIAVVVRAPSAAHDFVAAFEEMKPSRLPYLVAAAAAELLSFGFYAGLQSVLLRSGGERVRYRLLLRLSLASSGLRALLPAGSVVSSGWIYEKYRELDTPPSVSLFVVLASGFVSTVTLLGLLLVGAAVAGVGSPLVLGISGAVLVFGSAAFVALVHRLDRLGHLVGQRPGRLRELGRKGLHFAQGVAVSRVGWRAGTVAFGHAAGNWLADIVCLIAAFSLLAQPVPWRALLFAYCAAQLAGSIVPLPGGLGAVEGGLVASLDLLGVPVGTALAAALLYRVVTYWGVAAVGGVEAFELSRHPLGGRSRGSAEQEPAAERPRPVVPSPRAPEERPCEHRRGPAPPLRPGPPTAS